MLHVSMCIFGNVHSIIGTGNTTRSAAPNQCQVWQGLNSARVELVYCYVIYLSAWIDLSVKSTRYDT